MPGGRRLPKRPECKPFIPAPVVRNFQNWRNPVGTTPAGFLPAFGSAMGDFKNDEYRFWIKARYTDNLCSCRWCKLTGSAYSVRQEHQKKYGCTTKLRRAYSLLLERKPKVCVVCEKPTRNEMWGIPMCNNEQCVESWKHSYGPHKLLVGACTAINLLDTLKEDRE